MLQAMSGPVEDGQPSKKKTLAVKRQTAKVRSVCQKLPSSRQRLSHLLKLSVDYIDCLVVCLKCHLLRLAWKLAFLNHLWLMQLAPHLRPARSSAAVTSNILEGRHICLLEHSVQDAAEKQAITDLYTTLGGKATWRIVPSRQPRDLCIAGSKLVSSYKSALRKHAKDHPQYDVLRYTWLQVLPSFCRHAAQASQAVLLLSCVDLCICCCHVLLSA